MYSKLQQIHQASKLNDHPTYHCHIYIQHCFIPSGAAILNITEANIANSLQRHTQ